MTAKIPFSQRLLQDTPLLADGAMGTELFARAPLRHDACLDALNVDEPDLVRGVHLDYIRAGADIIETNTFGSNRIKLAESAYADRTREFTLAGVARVREAIAESQREDVYIAGSVGPLGGRLKPYGRIERESARQAFREQIEALLEGDVDFLLFETFANDDELLLAVGVARELTELPIVAQATFGSDDTTGIGHSPARVAHELYKAGVTVMGVNCSGGPQQLSNILQTMVRAVPSATFSVMPNAGFPELLNGRTIYPASADYFGDYAPRFQRIGASIIGGCCGTTPEHISAMRRALDAPSTSIHDVQVMDSEGEGDEDAPLPPTHLAERLASGQFTVTVEVAPPRSYTADKVLNAVRRLREAGADLIDVADTPAARMKMSAWALSHLLQSQIGMETVLHFPTRGRNILRIQGDLLAAHALGLRNLFITMGDPPRIGDFPDANDQFDIAPSKLIEVVKQRFNQGEDLAQNSIGQPTHFTVGCALNMGADDLDRELRVLDKKLEAGADFALGQPVFEPAKIDRFLTRYRERNGADFNLPVIMGVLPLYSLRHAMFLHNEVPGFSIPDALLKRMEDADESAPQEGVKIAIELMNAMRDRVQGAYIIPAFGRYSLAAEVCDGIVNTGR
jgi:methionine synthase I (cobalamin-dependent)/5,10-methylenetetrahydrofolate reductase